MQCSHYVYGTDCDTLKQHSPALWRVPRLCLSNVVFHGGNWVSSGERRGFTILISREFCAQREVALCVGLPHKPLLAEIG